MKLHAFLLGQTTEPTIDTRDMYQTLIDDTRFAEEVGFDGAWFAEHHFSNYAMVPNSLTLLAALARETKRIRLGTSIILLPLRNPVLVAEELAMVDQLSDGRLEAGFGRGYQPYEFDRLGIDFSEAGPRLVEGIDLLTHLFANPDQPFEGRHYKTGSLTITPAPRQLPHPPFWIAAGSAESMGFALERGLSIVCNVGNNGPDLASKLVDTFHAECRKREIDPKSVRFALQTHGYLVESKDEEDTVVRSGGFLHRVQVRLREQRHQIVRGINEASGHEKGEPTYAGWSAASLIGDREHIERQAARFAGLGISDLFITLRFGEFKTPGTRRSMQAITEAVNTTNAELRKAS
ncbi:LLM class flavin-dependent oxidoreductase [Bosea sp. PAMC 26642]|uniref:LLM class flavin-dependent oxidoreductase n=1 Tax=Bosea sp. (strain PAMC 26642) TaxID=1792307 RepID=UPI0007700B18|nr:LLM class flavin-dependent oxidoreductase [Bosea sp. PAMC 26642]AMJ61541.1 hypothetical protein AXW83_15620 [Bosea sp. PAMC 26642]